LHGLRHDGHDERRGKLLDSSNSGGGPAGYTTYAAATPVTQSFPVYGTTQAISFTPPAGTYSSAQTVTSGDSVTGAAIYYTTDGSTPTTASTPYAGAITVSSTETLSASDRHCRAGFGGLHHLDG
jgi:hypothetical protein